MSTLLETPTALRVEEVNTPEGLEALRPEWSALWERSPTATPFQSPEWLLPWWRHFGGEGLWTLVLRREGRLVGLAPFFIYTDPESGIRQMTLVGNGISDHLDLILDPEVKGEGGAAVLAHLAKRGDAWDTCDFRDLPAGSPLLGMWLPDGMAGEVEEEEPCPTLALPDTEARLAEVVPGKLLGTLCYRRRRAEKLGEVRFKMAGEESAEELFGALLRLHGARWAVRGEEGVFSEPGVDTFHREVLAGFLARGWLRLHALCIAGRVVAVHYGFVAKGRGYSYIGGFDPESEKVSPGGLVVEHAIREALREGAREFDFLRGREPYKYAWGAVDRPQYRRRMSLG
jgi:CelD/BcsL family acetyltransferase involved in cellulose biosynthesis